MIAQLTGKLVHKSPQNLIIDVGGVGYRVMVSLTTFAGLPEPGESVTIQTHTHMREDAISLFGFTTVQEKNIFLKLISISGVGPKIALTILSGLPANDLADAIAREDVLRLQSVPGVGKKTAERIVVELKDKIAKEHALEPASHTGGSRQIYEDVLSALTNLGYQRAAAENAMKRVEWNDMKTIEAALRATLKEIAKP
jgi:Holliday junction DNA helicase RuvA